MITATKINSLTDIDFDVLFDATLPILDAEENYWHDKAASYEDKKAHTVSIFNFVNSMEKPSCFKVDVDGLTVAVIFGYIHEGQHTILVGLLREDANGSRSYVYDAGWAQAVRDITTSDGATSGSMRFYTGSKTCQTFEKVYNATESDLTYLTPENDWPVTILRIWPLDSEREAP
tara:strand:- start:476 stop:1000 length:525 start_codon:yes stop_codon:yes gene_type:complete